MLQQLAYLQPFCLSGLNIQSTRFATNCPNATIAMFVDTILPRTWDGAHSAKYIGIVVDVKPEINIIHIEKGSTKLNVDNIYKITQLKKIMICAIFRIAFFLIAKIHALYIIQNAIKSMCNKNKNNINPKKSSTAVNMKSD